MKNLFEISFVIFGGIFLLNGPLICESAKCKGCLNPASSSLKDIPAPQISDDEDLLEAASGNWGSSSGSDAAKDGSKKSYNKHYKNVKTFGDSDKGSFNKRHATSSNDKGGSSSKGSYFKSSSYKDGDSKTKKSSGGHKKQEGSYSNHKYVYQPMPSASNLNQRHSGRGDYRDDDDLTGAYSNNRDDDYSDYEGDYEGEKDEEESNRGNVGGHSHHEDRYDDDERDERNERDDRDEAGDFFGDHSHHEDHYGGGDYDDGEEKDDKNEEESRQQESDFFGDHSHNRNQYDPYNRDDEGQRDTRQRQDGYGVDPYGDYSNHQPVNYDDEYDDERNDNRGNAEPSQSAPRRTMHNQWQPLTPPRKRQNGLFRILK